MPMPQRSAELEALLAVNAPASSHPKKLNT